MGQDNSTLTVTDALPQFYKNGVAWASGLLTVIPGHRETKAPLVPFKPYLRSGGRRLPSVEEQVHFRLEGTEGANPLLLLESPVGDAYCICVIDVDHMPSMKAVGEWLIAKGVVAKGGAQPLVVTTGREGGGQHLYFLCEAENAALYRSKNGASLFGTYTGSDGKEHGCVDFKSVGAYVVAPGANHKSGKLYRAWHCGQEVLKLSDVIAKLPVLPLEVWNEGRFGTSDQQAQKRAAAENTQWVIEGPEWAEVVGHADKELIVCPWCRARGSNSAIQGKTNLVWNADSGTAYCHREQRLYRLRAVREGTPDRDLNWASVDGLEAPTVARKSEIEERVDAAFAAAGLDVEPVVAQAEPVGDRSFKLDPVGWAIDAIGQLLDEELGPKAGDIGAIFPDDDPLAEWSSEAVRAAAIAERAGLLSRKLICPNGPTTMVAGGSVQESHKNSCRKWHCSFCGHFKLEALRASVAATLQTERRSTGIELRGPERRSTGIELRGNASLPVERRSFSWNTQAYDYQGFDALAKKLKRWASKAEGRGWLALRTTPVQVAVVAWGAGLTSWPLAEGAEFGELREVSQDTLDCIDLPAWRAWREEEKSARIAAGDDRDVKVEILLAPSALKGKIARLVDFVLGWDRNGLSTARGLTGAGWSSVPTGRKKESSEDFATITTYKHREVLRMEGDILQQVLVPEEVGSGHERLDFGEGFSAAKLLKQVVEETPSLHAHKGGKTPAQRRPTVITNDLLD